MKAVKDRLFVAKHETFPVDQYVRYFFKQFGSGHPTACVYQFIGDDMEEMFNKLHFFWIRTVY